MLAQQVHEVRHGKALMPNLDAVPQWPILPCSRKAALVHPIIMPARQLRRLAG